VLKDFRKRRLIRIEQKMLTVPDLPELQRLAGLSRDYLKLDRPSGELQRYFATLEPNGFAAADEP
jgi:hypothetical protein